MKFLLIWLGAFVCCAAVTVGIALGEFGAPEIHQQMRQLVGWGVLSSVAGLGILSRWYEGKL